VHYIFSNSGKSALTQLRDNQRSLFAFDFDGTLTQIVRRPTDALLPDLTRRILQDLATRARVAIISGRALISLENLICSPKIWLIGNHGIEGLDWPAPLITDLHRIAQGWAEVLNSRAWAGVETENCELENKTYSLSLHYRNAKNQNLAKQEALNSIQKLTPSPRCIFGKCVINLIPKQAPNKGKAILELMLLTHRSRAIYVGDDYTDEDVFALNHPDIVTVRIGQSPNSRARFYLEKQTEVDTLLRYLLRQSQADELPLAGTSNPS